MPRAPPAFECSLRLRGPGAISHGSDPLVIWIVTVSDGRRGNRSVRIGRGVQRIVAIPRELSDLLFLVHDLPQTAGRVLVKILHLRTISILLADQTPLNIDVPELGAPHRVGQAADVAA